MSGDEEGRQGQRKLGGRRELGEVRWSVPQALQGRRWGRHLLDVKLGRRETEQAKTVTPEPRGWEDGTAAGHSDGACPRNAPCRGGGSAARGQGRRRPLLCGALSVGSAPAVSGSESITWTLPGEAVGEFKGRAVCVVRWTLPAPLYPGARNRP